ncbi:MAG: hypothetical protein WC979_03215 [Candidatus Pacearchaeota archaeon]|jgi:hypothetical protein|nr:hypothetical protein [Clostridia bacterium]
MERRIPTLDEHINESINESLEMYKANKEKNEIKFINVGTLKDFIANSGIKDSMYTANKEKSIIKFINYAELKNAISYLEKKYNK